MPPLRTANLDKPVKTERTHEENQERAYIAASRRSDRSLEARIESARRASEIHKRRTGRSLRVTEADVINEEMYEEEDDDLPMQYRRLTAHLQTNSTDFNRRLAAYLTSQMAMRAALDQAIMNTYGSQSAAAAAYLQNQQAVQQASFSPAGIHSPQSPTSPSAYPQFPYSFKQSSHDQTSSEQQRTTSVEQNQKAPYSSSIPADRHSGDQTSAQPNSSSQEAGHSPETSNLVAGARRDDTKQGAESIHDIAPLTTSLPPESIRLLTNPLDPSNPMNASYLSGDEKIRHSLNSFHPPSTFNNFSQFHHTYDGMSQTLAPCALDSNEDRDNFISPTSAHSEEQLSPEQPLDSYNFGSLDHDGDATITDEFSAELDRDIFGDKDWTQYIDTSWE